MPGAIADQRKKNRGRRALLLLLLGASTLCSGCQATGEWLRSRTRPGPWLEAASPTNPNHWSSIAVLATVPFWRVNDRRLGRHWAEGQYIAGKNGADNGDIVLGAYMALPLIPIAWDAATKESGRWEVAEVAIESTLVTAGLTAALKEIVGRQRPHKPSASGRSTKSFPSGHTTATMTGAVLMGRWLREKSRWFIPLEILLYAGVGYVGATRVENYKHWPSDVAGSIALAGWVTNTIWDAHFGRDGKDGLFGTSIPTPIPVPTEDGLMFYFTWNF